MEKIATACYTQSYLGRFVINKISPREKLGLKKYVEASEIDDF